MMEKSSYAPIVLAAASAPPHKGLKSPKRFTDPPPLGVNVINFEVNGFNAFIWVTSDTKKL